MAKRREAQHIRGKHVSQPLVDEYVGSEFLDEPAIKPEHPTGTVPLFDDETYASIGKIAEPIADPITDVFAPAAAGGFKPVVSAAQMTDGDRADYYAREAAYANSGKEQGWWDAPRIATLILGLLLAAIVGFIGFQVFKASYKADINEQLRPENVDDAEAARQVLTPTTSRDPFYLMIIGSDSRNDGDAERSDTNIVARVDPQNGIITMVSIPRDTAVTLGSHGTQKFNAAYAYDGIPGTIRAAESLLGVKISHYAKVDFDGMKGLVDALGGVDVDVPVRIDDPDAGPVVIEAGQQHLNGEQALTFARSRAYTTGDFQRSTNQRLLLEAMLKQCMTLTEADLLPVIESATEFLDTDMTVTMLHDYALYFMNFDDITVYSVMVPSDVAMSDGVSYVVCDTVALQKVMQAVDAGLDPSVYVTDYTVYSSSEAEEQGVEDAIGIDSRLIEGTGEGSYEEPVVYEESYEESYQEPAYSEGGGYYEETEY